MRTHFAGYNGVGDMHVCVHVCMQWQSLHEGPKELASIAHVHTAANARQAFCRLAIEHSRCSCLSMSAMQITLQRCRCSREELRDVIFGDNRSLVPAVDI